MGMKLKRNSRPARPFELTTIKADHGLVAAVASDTRRRLDSGENMRCACCLDWAEAATAGIGVYIAPTGDARPYVLCPKCAHQVTVSESARRRVSAYVSGIS